MNNKKIEAGLKALAGEVPPLPAKTSVRLHSYKYSSAIIHYPVVMQCG